MKKICGNALVELGENVVTKEDFAAFLLALSQNFQEHPEEWENNTIGEYLEGLHGFAVGAEGYYSNMKISMDVEKASWRIFADFLLAARVFE